jgi:OOP family OmpA-OmpF porin
MQALSNLAVWAVIGLLTVNTAVAQQVPEPLMLFFDWSKPDIRGDDQPVLDRAVAAWQARPGTRLMLSGHTDRSGGAAYNLRAARRRAEMVSDELVKRGIPRNAIRVASFGEEQPLVPTEDGVREVQNRRVVITLEE